MIFRNIENSTFFRTFAFRIQSDYMAKQKTNGDEPLEKQLWKAADKLRKNIDAAEYKHVVLGLIFLKYISDAFEELYARLQADAALGADPEDRDEYKAENVFFVPADARWSLLLSKAKLPEIGKFVDDAMDAIEKENPSLKGVLPKVYARQNLDATALGELLDLIGNIALGDVKARSADVLGHVFEYFLGEFALAEGKKGGQFYTPRSVVELLVEMLQPFAGRVFDPCCGSGGMFVQSEKFVVEHQGRVNDLSIYGQESNQTTWRLCKMNLAIRGIDSSQVRWNNEGSFLNDAHPDLRADFIIANPPFNDSDWSGNLLRTDGRWKYGIPPESNANYAWIQHFITHLSTHGKAGFLLATKALASESNVEKNIRKGLVNDDCVECIVLLSGKLFYTTPAPVSLWILSRGKSNRAGKTLFIDASRKYADIDRTHRTLNENIINDICNTYHNWLSLSADYKDIPGYCKSAAINEIVAQDYSLYPGAYIGVNVEKSDLKDKIIAKNNIFEATTGMEKELKVITNLSTNLNDTINTEITNGCFEKIRLKLRDVLEESNEILGNRNEPDILSITENAGLVLQRERFSKRVATEDTSSYKVVRETDIVFNPYLLWAGAIDQCWIVKEGITSPAYTVLKIKQQFEPFIIGHILRSSLMQKHYWNISIGTHERRRTADVEKFLDLEITLPDFKAQSRISKIFSEMLAQKQAIQSSIKTIDLLTIGLCEYYTGI
jgi:type I restriction enzyme M protein